MEGNVACNHDFGEGWRETKPEFMECQKCGKRIGPITWELPDWLMDYGRCCEALGLDFIIFGDIARAEGIPLDQTYRILKRYCTELNKPLPSR